jgi:hypothetical protein
MTIVLAAPIWSSASVKIRPSCGRTPTTASRLPALRIPVSRSGSPLPVIVSTAPE